MYPTFPQMSIDAHISGSASQALVFPVLDVLARLRVNVLLGQAKVDNVHHRLVLCMVPPHQKVLWLHVSVYQVLVVDILNSGYLHGGKMEDISHNQNA